MQSVPGGAQRTAGIWRGSFSPMWLREAPDLCRGKDTGVRAEERSRDPIEGERAFRQRAQQVERHGGVKEFWQGLESVSCWTCLKLREREGRRGSF